MLREVEVEVLSTHQPTLLQKEHSGCAALLRDDKVETLPRFDLIQIRMCSCMRCGCGPFMMWPT